MVRVVFSGEELQGFTSLGFDDHVRLFFSAGEGPSPGTPADDRALPTPFVSRDFTPHRFDAEASELSIDFYLHDAGPASNWARTVRAGQRLSIGGPRSSSIISIQGIDTNVFVGDETALPAIGRRLEELPDQASVLVILQVEDGSKDYPLPSRPGIDVQFVDKDAGADSPGRAIISYMRTAPIPSRQCFTWVACESRTARAIRRYLVEERAHDKRWIKAAGYWQRGAVGVHDLVQETD
jgi:NADPH-dependent ferric siderophore reductase